MNKPKIYFITTVEVAVNLFLLKHLKKLCQYYDITVITKTSDHKFLIKRGIKAKVIPLKIFREINLFFDFICLLYLFFLFIKNKPNAVHSLTPKAGALTMLAGYLAFVPLRIHTFTGQVWANTKGFKRFLLKSIDTMIAKLSKFNFVDSFAQREFLVKNKILTFEKSLVFGQGSICGVDIKKFKPNKKTFYNIRKKLLIPIDSFVILYLGRINKDKGILDLAKAFQKIKSKKVYLIILGHDEGSLIDSIINICKLKYQNLRFINFTEKREKYIAAADILCIPSYREGFSQSIIEAAAMRVPSIGSNIYGIKEAIVDKKSGILITPKNVNSIIKAINFFRNNPKKKYLYGKFAMKRVHNFFSDKILTNEWVKFYKKNLT